MNADRKHTRLMGAVNHRSLKWIALCAIALSYALAGAASRAADAITVEQPWMRFIIKARPAGGYFTLHNNTSKPVELTGASSSACGMVMLHQSKSVNGIEKMLPVKSVAVPPHGTLEFRPGSYHLMCMKPKDTMMVGHKVPVTLEFAGGKMITTDFSVKGVGGK